MPGRRVEHGRYAGRVNSANEDMAPHDDAMALVAQWVYLPDVAQRIGESDRRVRSMVREQRVLAFRVGPNRALAVPEDMIVVDARAGDGSEEILPSLRGSLIQLSDAGYADLDSLRWLYTQNEELDARPIDALRAGRTSSVRRAAQALAF